MVGRYEVTVLCPHSPGAAREEILDGVRIVRYRYAPVRLETMVNDGGIVTNLKRARWKWLLVPAFFLTQWWALARILRTYRPNIIHAHWLIPQGIVTAAAHRNIPFLVTSHGADLFAINGALFTWLRGRVLNRAKAVTVVSEAMKRRLQTDHPLTLIDVIPMGVDFTSLFTPLDQEVRSSDSILFVGRLVEKKGVIHLINAMPLILAVKPYARLQVVGSGPEKEKLAAAVRKLQLEHCINFLGAREQKELPSLFRKAAVFAAPFVEALSGDQEGLGLVVAEAIACHCPVVVGNVPAVHDLVDPDLAFIVPQANPAALADAIIAVLNDPRAAHSRAIALRRNLEAKVSWQTVAQKYSDLLLRLS